jgi:hypothetical protein
VSGELPDHPGTLLDGVVDAALCDRSAAWCSDRQIFDVARGNPCELLRHGSQVRRRARPANEWEIGDRQFVNCQHRDAMGLDDGANSEHVTCVVHLAGHVPHAPRPHRLACERIERRKTSRVCPRTPVGGPARARSNRRGAAEQCLITRAPYLGATAWTRRTDRRVARSVADRDGGGRSHEELPARAGSTATSRAVLRLALCWLLARTPVRQDRAIFHSAAMPVVTLCAEELLHAGGCHNGQEAAAQSRTRLQIENWPASASARSRSVAEGRRHAPRAHPKRLAPPHPASWYS